MGTASRPPCCGSEHCKALARPLEAALRETDALIDAIVYRLYGLTPEEVAVVEGEAGRAAPEQDAQ